ncbi:MAG: cobalamin B12-binding domain-containing protein [Nitrospirae bacterium]|nr:cobalamin B12-binding domain-containing protein [Nitrospirota bacterium]
MVSDFKNGPGAGQAPGPGSPRYPGEFAASRGGTEALVWIADLTYTQRQVSSDVIPAAIGSLAAFVLANVKPKPRVRLFKYPEKLITALQKEKPRILGFSNYVWNLELSYAIAQLVKGISEETLVVFGGPNYPIETPEQEAFLREHPAIDFYVVKEGEAAFCGLLQACADVSYDKRHLQRFRLSGVHCRTSDGQFIGPPNADRLRDLTVIPSPYLMGLLDEFFDGNLMPIVQTNRGCPFSCTFCVEGLNYYGKVYRNGREKVAAEIAYIGRKMAERRSRGGRNDLYIADSNFGMYLDDLETCRALAASREMFGWPEYVNATTGKSHKLRVLESAKLIRGALRISGSVQSMDPEVLKNIKRSNIDTDKLLDLSLKADEVGANSCSEVILGLPGDTREKHLRSLELVIDAGFKSVLTHQAMMLPGTELTSSETRKKHGLQTRFRVLPRCFGHYVTPLGSVTSAEIEEICVSSLTLSFEDYFACRQFDLVVACFHNEGTYKGLLRLLKQAGLSGFAWLRSIFESRGQSGIKDFFDDFLAETRDELWESKDALLEFTRRPENVERYLRGELGTIVLFKYKAMAITRHMTRLAEIARNTALTALGEAGKMREGIEEFVDDILTYEVLRKRDLLEGESQHREVELRYDVQRFVSDPSPREFGEYAFPAPKRARFFHDAEQVEMLERHARLFGRGDEGIIRLFSNVHLDKLFRRVDCSQTTLPPEHLPGRAGIVPHPNSEAGPHMPCLPGRRFA